MFCRYQGYKIIWLGEGGMVPGKKMKNEALRNIIKKKEKRGKEKEEKEKGESLFFVNIWHTLFLISVY